MGFRGVMLTRGWGMGKGGGCVREERIACGAQTDLVWDVVYVRPFDKPLRQAQDGVRANGLGETAFGGVVRLVRWVGEVAEGCLVCKTGI